MNYHRYGLSENPYEAEVLGIGDTAHFEKIHPLLDEAELTKDLSAAIGKGKLAFLVVTGSSGSGRTAVARHAMTLYGELCAKPPGAAEKGVAYYERFHDGNLDARQVSKEVLKGLAEEVKRLGALFKDEPCKELRDGLKDLGPDYSIQDLQSLARDFTEAVYDRKGATACSIENIPNASVFSGLRTMFEKSQGLVISTVLAEQREAVLGALKPHEIGAEIPLGDLPDDCACLLASGATVDQVEGPEPDAVRCRRIAQDLSRQTAQRREIFRNARPYDR